MNDPNGMVYYKGVYHLFYQYYPSATVWGPMHWGHATSTDLVHWHPMPIALYPDKKIGRSEVQGMIFSGSVVFDQYNTSGLGSRMRPPMVAVYTLADTFGAGSGQRQAIAYSTDSGVTWKKYTGNPVIPYNHQETFRDPQVMWFGGQSKWVMVISCGDKVCFYNSPDLKQWHLVGDFGKTESGIGVPWECPDLFPLQVMRNGKIEKKWVLVVSVQHGAPNGSFGTRYFVGDFDGKAFTDSALSSDSKWIDYGGDYYAARTWVPSSAKLQHRVLLGWMANWTYAKDLPATTYRGSMTVPRELTLRFDGSGYYLAQRPVRSVLQGLAPHRTAIVIDSTYAYRSVTTGPAAEIDVNFKRTADNSAFVVDLFKSGNQQVSIAYDAVKSEISVDRRSYAGYQFPAAESFQHAPVALKDGHLKAQILLDRGSVELFVNDGKVTFTNLVYPKETLTETVVVEMPGKNPPPTGVTEAKVLAH